MVGELIDIKIIRDTKIKYFYRIHLEGRDMVHWVIAIKIQENTLKVMV